MTRKLKEGLTRHDLDDLILPMIDIDTFESKIDNSKVIVVAFYVFDRYPAVDLKVFIERGSVSVLDVEVSPAPTVDGYFVVFVEMDRNHSFPEELVNIVEAVNNLTNVTEWQFKTLGSDEIFDLTEENLKEHTVLDPKMVPPSEDDIEDEIDDIEKEEEEDSDEEDKSIAEMAIPILRNGLMETVIADDMELSLVTPREMMKYKVLYVFKDQPSAPTLYPQIGDPLLRESMRLSAILGNSYTVDIVNDGLLVSGDSGHLILKPLD